METETEELYEEQERFEEIEEKHIPSSFTREFLQKPGEHLLGIGITGSGKTMKAYWLLKKLMDYEEIIWFDTGKSYGFGQYEEFGPLFNFGMPINIIMPKGGDFDISGSPVEVTKEYCNTPRDLWTFIKPGAINVVSVSRFFIDPELHGKWAAQAFKELIIISINERDRLRDVIPLSVFYDEFSDIAPGDRMRIARSQEATGKLMAHNIKQLRSIGVRMVCFTQSYFNLLPGVRSSFSWILACRGTYIERHEPVIAQYNKLHGSLDVSQAILWYPTRNFQDIWKFPLYTSPEGLKIRHRGILTSI